MIRLVIDGVDVPVPDNFSVQLNYENPLFLNDKVNKAYSYNFTLPVTEQLQNILKHRNRVSTINKTLELPCKLYHSGVLFVEGILKLTNINSLSYACFIRNDALTILDKMRNTKLNTVSLPTVEVWTQAEDTSLDILAKLERWSNFMMDNADKPVTSGMYKFPTIKANYNAKAYEAGSFDDIYLQQSYFPTEEASVNHFVNEKFHSNELYYFQQTATAGAVKSENWLQTVSPCLRIEYLFERMLNELGIVYEENDLLDIIEFMRMVCFSGRVLDQHFYDILPVISNTLYVNMHGRLFSLTDFIPDVYMWDLYYMLIDMFNIVSTFSENEVSIQLANHVLKKQAVDFTKYSEDFYSKGIDTNKAQGMRIKYEFEDTVLAWLNRPKTFYTNPLDERGLNYFGLQFEIGEDPFTERTVRYMPIGSNGLETSDPSGVKDFGGPVVGGIPPWPPTVPTVVPAHPNLFPLYARMPFDPENGVFFPVNSKTYVNEAKNYDFLAVTQYLGIIDTYVQTPTEKDNDLPPTNTKKTNACACVDSTLTFEEGSGWPNFGWGTKTLWMGEVQQREPEDADELTSNQDTESKGLWNTYHKEYHDFMMRSVPIEKTLFLPPHKVKELSTFKEPKHVIDSPEGKFEGFVQKFSVTLYKDRISPTKVTYLIEQYD
jgi:hypothetical protein